MTNKKIKQKMEETFEEVFLENGNCILLYGNLDNSEQKICITAKDLDIGNLSEMVKKCLLNQKFLIPLFLKASAEILSEEK